MFISKSLFVDYKEYPKLAWWKINNIDKYKFINDIQDDEWELEIVELWQRIENIVWKYLFKKYWYERYDVFEDNPLIDLEEEDEDILLKENTYKNKLEANIERTKDAIKRREPLIYQAWFMYNQLFVRADYLILNENWNYDLIEVKAKTWVRKSPTFQGKKNKNKWELDYNFLSDISFQKYVISKCFEKFNLWKLDNFYYAYLNHKFIKSWNIDELKLITLDRVDTLKIVILEGTDENKEKTINDVLIPFSSIESTIKDININLTLSEKEFNKIFMFWWTKYIKYFWEPRPFWTIFSRWIDQCEKAVRSLYYDWIHKLDDLDYKQIESFNKDNWTKSKARLFIDNYLKSKKDNNKSIIIEDSIHNEFSKFNYPLCFYDYESVSVPVPFIDNTSPYQQVVVQYSLHKVYEDGSIEHFWWILEWLSEEKSVRKINIENNQNQVENESEKIITWSYKDLLEEFLLDIWDDIDNSTFVVWYKPFENSRNKETAKKFTDLANSYLKINENTFDLMDIFKKWYYYDLWFKWSNSIKYILPALVPTMSYNWMDVPNGSVAMKLLSDIISWEIKNLEEKEKHLTNLLLYCWQDSIAMYKIYLEILKHI